MADSQKLNLYQKIAVIANEIGAISKTGRNTNQNYNFIEEAEVMKALKPLLAKHQIAIIPEVLEHTLVPKEKGQKIIVKMNFLVVNAENPEDRIARTWFAEGDDTLDKGTNKAETAGQKYFMMKLFKVSDKDDPDSQSVDTGKFAGTNDDKATPAQFGKIFAVMKEKGINTPDHQKQIFAFFSPKASKTDLTKTEASEIISKLTKAKPDELKVLTDEVKDDAK